MPILKKALIGACKHKWGSVALALYMFAPIAVGAEIWAQITNCNTATTSAFTVVVVSLLAILLVLGYKSYEPNYKHS